MSKLAYIGVPTEVPIYESSEETVSINGENIGSYFNINNGIDQSNWENSAAN